ncbi:hypothetical protein HY632_00255 [Candidatus Uhrbacteria bacterium]|nr:hypothetical protein [Candidatus Uhrbacteria bacterium]
MPHGTCDPTKDLGATMRLLNAVLEKSTTRIQHIDTQINVLVGLSSALFVFSASQALATGYFFFLALALTGASAALLALFAIHPPRIMRKRGQTESLFYNRTIESFPSAQAYAQHLQKLVGQSTALVEEYAREAYNLSKFYYRPKRELFRASRNVLLLGIVASCILFVWE